MRLTLPKIYPITDRQLSGLSHAEQVQRLINGGATLVQLREKHLPPIHFFREADLVICDTMYSLADSVSMAMLLVLETLTPTERAVFVLREVFETPYDEIAEAVGKTLAAVRQIAAAGLELLVVVMEYPDREACRVRDERG